MDIQSQSRCKTFRKHLRMEILADDLRREPAELLDPQAAFLDLERFFHLPTLLEQHAQLGPGVLPGPEKVGHQV